MRVLRVQRRRDTSAPVDRPELRRSPTRIYETRTMLLCSSLRRHRPIILPLLPRLPNQPLPIPPLLPPFLRKVLFRHPPLIHTPKRSEHTHIIWADAVFLRDFGWPFAEGVFPAYAADLGDLLLCELHSRAWRLGDRWRKRDRFGGGSFGGGRAFAQDKERRSWGCRQGEWCRRRRRRSMRERDARGDVPCLRLRRHLQRIWEAR